MQTLVVTHWDHREELLTQCKTMYRWLEPQPHVIICNETDGDRTRAWHEWYNRTCVHYLRNRPTRVLDARDIIHGHLSREIELRSGYTRQQVFKLWWSTQTDEPYLVLDDKNWFTRAVTAHSFPRQPRTFDPWRNRTYQSFARSTRDLLGEPILQVRRIETPYPIDPRVLHRGVEQLWQGSWLQMLSWLARHRRPSEFVLYDALCQQQNVYAEPGEIRSSVMWGPHHTGDEAFDVKEFQRRCELYDVIAVHKTWHKQVSFAKLTHHLLYGRFQAQE
jgi:hypothetical protein